MSIRTSAIEAVPDSLRFTKPRSIKDGIRQEQLVIPNQNTITQPTPGGSEIQFWIPQLPNTWWDPETAYFVIHAVGTFQQVSNWQAANPGTPTMANDANGCIIGSFYSLFQRYAVWANGLNQTDDILEVGIVALRVLNITMTRQAREAMAFMFGFQNDPFSCASLAGYRIKGTFPFSADSDSAVLMNQYTSPTLGGQQGIGLPAAYYFNQNFDFAIPLIGTLGANNPSLYYLGLGNTKVSLFTEVPANFLLLPPGNGETRYVPTAAGGGGAFPIPAANTASTLASGGLQLANWAITRARLVANTLILSQAVMQQVIAMAGSQVVSLCQTFKMSQQNLQQGLSGLQQVTFSIRAGSMNYVIVLFNNTGTSNATYTAPGSTNLSFVNSAFGTGYLNTGTGGYYNNAVNAGVAEIANFFNKYSSINPGLGSTTKLTVNNTDYPKNGALNPTQYPSETLAYMAEGMNMYSNSDQKWGPPPQNWAVADPNVIISGLQANNFPAATQQPSTQSSQFWRCGAICNGINQVQVNTTIGCTTCPFFKWCLVSIEILNGPSSWNGQEKYVMSNDFFLFFGLQDQSRKGMISGKNTMDGSNFLNMNLSSVTSYAYSVYFVANCDILIVHDFETRNVYPII